MLIISECVRTDEDTEGQHLYLEHVTINMII